MLEKLIKMSLEEFFQLHMLTHYPTTPTPPLLNVFLINLEFVNLESVV